MWRFSTTCCFTWSLEPVATPDNSEQIPHICDWLFTSHSNRLPPRGTNHDPRKFSLVKRLFPLDYHPNPPWRKITFSFPTAINRSFLNVLLSSYKFCFFLVAYNLLAVLSTSINKMEENYMCFKTFEILYLQKNVCIILNKMYICQSKNLIYIFLFNEFANVYRC